MKKLFIALTALALTLTSMAQVTKTINSYAAGTLAIQLGSELATVTHLTITGYIDARDFVVLRDAMTQLEELDLSGAIIQSYSGSEGTNSWYADYPANELPQYAFQNPSNWSNNPGGLKKVTIPNTTTKVGSNAFRKYSLINIVLNSGLLTIGNNAFDGCGLIQSISIPNTVTSIGDYAFNSCYALNGEITLPSSLSDFGTYVFGGCTKITGYTINSSNQKFSTENGVIFNKDKTTIILYPIDKEGSYTIPNSVTKITNSAFSGCTKLSGSLTIPNSVITIEGYSFDNCTGLSGTLTLGSGLQTIGDNAFYNCSGIADFAISTSNANFEVVGGVLFNKAKTTLLIYPPGKAGSYTIPSSVTSIGKNAFRNCRKLSGELIIPNTLTTIGDNSFESCSGLDGTLTLGTGLTSIGGSAFSSCDGIKVINCLRITPPTTSSWAFYFSKYPTVYTPSAAAATAYKAATGWTNFPTILSPGFSLSLNSISGLNYSPGATTSDAKYFTISGGFLTGNISINAPTNFEISTVGGNTFSPQTSITLTQNGGMVAFDTIFVRMKTGLTANTYTGNISITSTGITTQTLSLSGTVRPVPELANVTTAGTLSTLFSLSEKAAVTKLKVTGSIDARDFKFMRDEMPLLADLDLSEASIIAYTGYDGTNWYSACLANELPEYSFNNKKALTTIKLPNSLTTIGNNAFNYCTGLTGMITIPNLVTSIGESAFSACTAMSEIVVGNNVTTIGNSVFYNCTGLKSITFGNSITTIGNYAFSNCSALEGNLIIPNSVTSIGTSLFSSCAKITSVTLGSGLLSVGEQSFYNCTGLKSITFGNSITTIGNSAFSNCSALEGNLIIPNSLNSIGNYAFYSCSRIEIITLGSGLITVGEGAFNSCTNLRIINSLNETPPTLGNYVFGWDYKQKVYVPSKSAVENYKLDSKWTNFTINPSGIQVSAVSISGLNYVPNSSNPDAKMFTVSGGILQGNIVITAPANFEISTNLSPSFSGQSSITLNQTYGVINLDSIYVRLKMGLAVNSYTGNLNIASIGYSNISIPLTGIVRNIPETINLTTSGTLSESLSATEKSSIIKLKLTGNIDVRDFKCLRDELAKLADLDLSNSNIVRYDGSGGTNTHIYSYLTNSIPSNAFNNKKLLKLLVLPTLIDDIGGGAFEGCGLKLFITKATAPTGSLSSMTLNNSIVYVPTGKVDVYKTAWGTATNVIIIDKDIEVTVNVTEVGKLATTVYNQTSIHPSLINKLTVTGILGATDITYIRDNMKQCYDVNLEGVNIADLPTDAFNGRSFLFAVKLPTNLKTIGSGAFYGCSNLSLIDFPTTLTTIGSSAYYGCSSLKVINAPSSVNSVGYRAFYGCGNLTDVTFNGDVIINNGSNSSTDGTFYGCSNLKNLTFNGATTIGSASYYYAGVFQNCNNLSTVTFNSTSSIGTNAFKNCNGLINLKIDKASNIGEAAFSGCTSLKSATIIGATVIGNSSFNGCSGLTNVTINGATSIGSYAFSSCTSLTTFDIPASVTSVGDAAFQSCTKLDSVKIGAKVATIGANAFSGCNKLSKITAYRLTPATLGLNVFNNVNTETCKLYLLEEAEFDAYFSAPQWGNFLKVLKINISNFMGDSNEDGTINITDIINVINYILEKPVTKFSMLYSDMNKDGGINVIDVVQIVKVITGGPTGAPRLKAKGMQQAGCTWDMVGNTFVAQADGGIRGFDVAYTGTYTALPALDDFSLVPYTKNGVKRLLGYTTGDAICIQPTSLFTLSDGGAFSDMTFVLDDGNNAPLVKGITTATASTEMQPTVVIENGFIRLQNSGNLSSIELYSLSGNLMARSLTNQIAIPSSAKGVYLLRINTAAQKLSYKVVL